MFKIFIILLIISLNYYPASAHTIWSIGKKDNSAAEFALSPKGYMDFLKNDFGWDDRSYIIGLSNEKKDWPYVLPGPADTWGGTSGTAGIRTHVLNILFRLNKPPLNGAFKLVIDVLDAQDKIPPYLKVTVNGKSWKFAVPAGKNGLIYIHNYLISLNTLFSLSFL